jgi:hypothetical protein
MRLDTLPPAREFPETLKQYWKKNITWWNDHNDGTRLWDNVNTFALNAQGISASIVSKTAAYTATSTDVVILVDSTAGTVTVTLPTAVNIKGVWYFIKDWKGQSATNNITIATTAGQTIDGGATKVLNVAYVSYMVVSDGANWAII